VRNSCKESHNHAEGHPAGKEAKGGLGWAWITRTDCFMECERKDLALLALVVVGFRDSAQVLSLDEVGF